MGYSYNVKASRTLDKIGEFHDNAHGRSNQYLLTNTQGKVVGFYEITRKDQPDGGIRGPVFRFVGNFSFENNENRCLRAGYFHINGDGKVIRFPLARIKDMKKVLA